ncbi:MAG: DUF6714 family protein [Gemmataceae bacterium]
MTAIRVAFAGVQRGSTTLHEAEVIDEYGSDQERSAARLLDVETSWDQVPDSFIEGCTTALCYLDPESWRFYIPAYMIWSLKNFRVSNSVVSDFTIYTFNPSGSDASGREYHMARYRMLDEAQSRAVCLFLRYMLANEDRADGSAANLALTEYWGVFCDNQEA